MDSKSPKQKRSEESLERMYAAVMALLNDHDWPDISVAMIAKEASVSTGLLYSRFKTKDALIHATLLRLSKSSCESLDVLWDQLPPESLSFEQRVDFVVDQAIESRKANPGISRALKALPSHLSEEERAQIITADGESYAALFRWMLNDAKGQKAASQAQRFAILLLTNMGEDLEPGTIPITGLSAEFLEAEVRQLARTYLLTMPADQ